MTLRFEPSKLLDMLEGVRRTGSESFLQSYPTRRDWTSSLSIRLVEAEALSRRGESM